MDEGFGAILVIGVVGVVIFLALRHSYQQSKSLDDVYANIAAHLNGKSIPGGFMGRPWVSFRLSGGPAKLDIHSTGGKHAKLYTQLHATWPDSKLRCEICPERFLHGVGKMLGMTDIQIGAPAFDDRYLIHGNSAADIRRVLSPDVQLAIENLRRFLGNDDIYISIRGGRLLVKKRSLIRDRDALRRFVRLAVRLHEAAMNTNADGIDFIDGQQHEAVLSLASAICQVCGDDIAVDAVFCRSCKTPHHKDCWEYYGSCSTYGCGQKRFLVIKKRSKPS